MLARHIPYPRIEDSESSFEARQDIYSVVAYMEENPPPSGYRWRYRFGDPMDPIATIYHDGPFTVIAVPGLLVHMISWRGPGGLLNYEDEVKTLAGDEISWPATVDTVPI